MPSRRSPTCRQFVRRRLHGCLLAATLTASPGALAQEQLVAQLMWQHQFQFADYYAAQGQGYYAEAGLEVRLLEAQRGV